MCDREVLAEGRYHFHLSAATKYIWHGEKSALCARYNVLGLKCPFDCGGALYANGKSDVLCLFRRRLLDSLSTYGLKICRFPSKKTKYM